MTRSFVFLSAPPPFTVLSSLTIARRRTGDIHAIIGVDGCVSVLTLPWDITLPELLQVGATSNTAHSDRAVVSTRSTLLVECWQNGFLASAAHYAQGRSTLYRSRSAEWKWGYDHRAPPSITNNTSMDRRFTPGLFPPPLPPQPYTPSPHRMELDIGPHSCPTAMQHPPPVWLGKGLG